MKIRFHSKSDDRGEIRSLIHHPWQAKLWTVRKTVFCRCMVCALAIAWYMLDMYAYDETIVPSCWDLPWRFRICSMSLHDTTLVYTWYTLFWKDDRCIIYLLASSIYTGIYLVFFVNVSYWYPNDCVSPMIHCMPVEEHLREPRVYDPLLSSPTLGGVIPIF